MKIRKRAYYNRDLSLYQDVEYYQYFEFTDEGTFWNLTRKHEGKGMGFLERQAE